MERQQRENIQLLQDLLADRGGPPPLTEGNEPPPLTEGNKPPPLTEDDPPPSYSSVIRDDNGATSLMPINRRMGHPGGRRVQRAQVGCQLPPRRGRRGAASKGQTPPPPQGAGPMPLRRGLGAMGAAAAEGPALSTQAGDGHDLRTRQPAGGDFPGRLLVRLWGPPTTTRLGDSPQRHHRGHPGGRRVGARCQRERQRGPYLGLEDASSRLATVPRIKSGSSRSISPTRSSAP